MMFLLSCFLPLGCDFVNAIRMAALLGNSHFARCLWFPVMFCDFLSFPSAVRVEILKTKVFLFFYLLF